MSCGPRQYCSMRQRARTALGQSYRLPTEAEWERAARGCFVSAPYPWGASDPDATKADFDRFTQLSVLDSRAFPPNDYGLFSMTGGVWEWCVDDYDAAHYARSPREEPLCKLPDTVFQARTRAARWVVGRLRRGDSNELSQLFLAGRIAQHRVPARAPAARRRPPGLRRADRGPGIHVRLCAHGVSWGSST